ncbi:MAG: hypothetical protein ACRDH6_10035 [Actinomycetota bacterium]
MHVASASLLDEVLPRFHFRSGHSTIVNAPRETVAETVESYRSDTSPLVRLFLRLRGLRVPEGTFRSALEATGFTVLSERPGEEILVGIVGRFWAFREQSNLITVGDVEEFVAFDLPGTAKAALTIRIESLPGGAGTRVGTETRVQCADRAAYRRFAIYWVLIKPFSGLLRRAFLQRVKRVAEASTR